MELVWIWVLMNVWVEGSMQTAEEERQQGTKGDCGGWVAGHHAREEPAAEDLCERPEPQESRLENALRPERWRRGRAGARD